MGSQIIYADHGSIQCIQMQIVTKHLRSNSVRACVAHACMRAWLGARGSWLVARGSRLVAHACVRG